jgi:hypothetical protein
MAVDVYQSVALLRIEVKNLNLSEIRDEIGKRIDAIVEYPGSRKSVDGQGGWWRLTEWAEHRIDQSLKKRGERV